MMRGCNSESNKLRPR